MNKKELLNKVIELDYGDEIPLFKGIYIIQQRKLHESGYKMMYVIGHTEYDKDKKDWDYYLVGTYSDVVDFQPIFEKHIKGIYNVCDLHLDINKNGIIHIWTNSEKYLQCQVPFLSSCSFEIVD